MKWQFIPEYLMPQGSDAWLAWRKSCRFTASGDPVKCVAGDPSHFNGSPHNWQDLREGKESPWTDEAERAASYGRRHEDAALDHFNSLSKAGLEYIPVCLETEIAGYTVGASLDGYAWDSASGKHRFVEIKCPYKQKKGRTWRDADEGVVPQFYLWQCAFQMFCLMQNGQEAEGVFFVFIPKGRGGPDYRAVQLTHEQLKPRIEFLSERIVSFLDGDDEPDFGWHLSDAKKQESLLIPQPK